MTQSRTTKLSKLLLVLSTVLVMVPFVINSHRRFDGPPPPEFYRGPHPMPMGGDLPMREGMRHRERANAMPADFSDRKVMSMPVQVDDSAFALPRPEAIPPPPHGRRHCMKGVLAGLVGVVGIVAGATESRKAVTTFLVVLVLAAVASSTMSIVRAHHKVENCRAAHSIAALGRDFRPELPLSMPQRPVFDRPMPADDRLVAQAGAANSVMAVNADVSVTAMDNVNGGVNQIQPRDGVEVVEVEEVEIDIEVGAVPNRRAAKALHKRGHWGSHGRRHGNEMPPHHGAPFHHGHGGDECEHSVKRHAAHKVGCSLLAAVGFFLLARMLRKSIVADESASCNAPATTTKNGGEIYEGVPVKCVADDIVVV